MPMPEELRKAIQHLDEDELLAHVRWDAKRDRILISLSSASRVLELTVDEAIELARMLLHGVKEAQVDSELQVALDDCQPANIHNVCSPDKDRGGG